MGRRGFPTTPGFWYFVPPGSERWTIEHHRFDPLFYWSLGRVPPILPYVTEGGWRKGGAPDPYPPPCVEFPQRFWADPFTVWEDIPIDLLCGTGCECGGIDPAPAVYQVDLTGFTGTSFPDRQGTPGVYGVPKILVLPCVYRRGFRFFNRIDVNLTDLGGDLVQVDVLVALSGVCDVEVQYRGAVRRQQLFRHFRIPRIDPAPPIRPDIPTSLPLWVQSDDSI